MILLANVLFWTGWINSSSASSTSFRRSHSTAATFFGRQPNRSFRLPVIDVASHDGRLVSRYPVRLRPPGRVRRHRYLNGLCPSFSRHSPEWAVVVAVGRPDRLGGRGCVRPLAAPPESQVCSETPFGGRGRGRRRTLHPRPSGRRPRHRGATGGRRRRASVERRLPDGERVGTAPPNVASDIADAIAADDLTYVRRATQGPYVNFLPSEAYFAETLQSVTESGFGRLPDRDTSVVVEHRPRTRRARSTSGGHATHPRRCRCSRPRFAGNDVDRHYYVNDAGRQVAVFTWAYETFDESELPEPERDRSDYDLVRYYRKGNAYLEDADDDEVEAAEAEVQTIMQGLEDGDEETYERVADVVDTVLGGMQNTLGRLPAEFDEFVKETKFMRNGDTDDLVERLKGLDCAVYEEDAWQLDLLGCFEKNLVFLRSDGTTLYTTRDLAHHEWKFNNYDEAVTVLGEDHKLQAEQLDAALEILGNDTDQLRQTFYSWVNLPEGGMSTRKGTGVDLDDLLDEAVTAHGRKSSAARRPHPGRP